jgi:hypothetical protein
MTEPMSEELQRHSGKDEALTLTFTVVVLRSQRCALRAEGERVWKEQRSCPPIGWTEADYIQYALKQRLRGGT